MRTLSIFLVAGLVTCAASAGDWPQWLGPNRDGTSAETIRPWQGDLKVLWRQPVGEGHSSPIVAGGLVFLHSKDPAKEQEIVQAWDAATGDLKWEQKYDKPEFKTLFGNGPRATPCVHEGKLYTFGITGILACWEASTGKPVWKTEVLADPKGHNLFFGLSASPLIVGAYVVVQGGGSGSKGIRAFDRLTGKAAWTAGDDPASYAAPVLLDGQIITLTGAHLCGTSTDGKLLWQVPFKDKLNESSTTPIKAGDAYIAASVTAGAIAVRVQGTKAEQIWKNPALNCYFSTPVRVGNEHLFLMTGGLSINPSSTLRCVEIASGKELWNKPNMGKYHAALLALADGNVLMHDDLTGNVRLLAPNVKQYQELAVSKAGGSTWAHPALANGRLYIRDNKELICLDVGAGPANRD